MKNRPKWRVLLWASPACWCSSEGTSVKPWHFRAFVYELRAHSALTFSRLLYGRIPGVENESLTATLENLCVLPLWQWAASPVRAADSISATLLAHCIQINGNGDNLEFILSGSCFYHWAVHEDSAEKKIVLWSLSGPGKCFFFWWQTPSLPARWKRLFSPSRWWMRCLPRCFSLLAFSITLAYTGHLHSHLHSILIFLSS